MVGSTCILLSEDSLFQNFIFMSNLLCEQYRQQPTDETSLKENNHDQDGYGVLFLAVNHAGSTTSTTFVNLVVASSEDIVRILEVAIEPCQLRATIGSFEAVSVTTPEA